VSRPPLPPLPPDVRYALSVPQSVLFGDLSLEGNRREVFQRAMQLDYEPRCIVIDAGGAMSWNYDADDAFNSLITRTTLVDGLQDFVHSTGSTARALLRTARILSRSATRRAGIADDILEDLEVYWIAYTDHMTSLFTFWNVEALLTAALIGGLRLAGRDADVADGLARYLMPSEANLFAIERRALERIARRFDPHDVSLAPALRTHIDQFGFLLAPFNLGDPPSVESVVKRIGDLTGVEARTAEPLAPISMETFDDLPGDLQQLARLARRLTFWKSDRLDAFSRADADVRPLYEEASALLDLSLEELFTMRSGEIRASLRAGVPVVDATEVAERARAYCLALWDGEIMFFQPSTAREGTGSVEISELIGTGASAGAVEGIARVIVSSDSYDLLQSGEILVTTMTRPEMGSALDRAAAFVTDQGGLMSHAAIIAREMRKPCVIGTEVATTAIRDGMRLRVDGDVGKVRILGGDG
jgi:phosphohistidine swiveling domain-containing protein